VSAAAGTTPAAAAEPGPKRPEDGPDARLHRLGRLGRLGRWAADHARIVFAAWAVLAVGLGIFAP